MHRFEVNQIEKQILSEYLSVREIQAVNEEKAPQLPFFDPISDDEDPEETSTRVQPEHIVLSSQALGKRPIRSISQDREERVINEGDMNNDGELVTLPDTQHRVSRRVRKRSRLLDGYETLDF